MKVKALVVLFSLFFLVTGIKAQNDPLKSITDIVGSQMGMGDVMGSLVNGIKPSSFTSGKSGKKDLINQLSGIKATDYLQYTSVAGQLAGALKGTSFLPGWASQKDGILDQLQSAGSMADVAGGVSGLLGNINPSSLSSGFKKNQSSITSALGILSMIK
ncbi:MAG: hypothetical protein IPL53_06450 [Ignavibacteria bacterium]|nr:hypothetical protein [Ignavibacteria bacterium]